MQHVTKMKKQADIDTEYGMIVVTGLRKGEKGRCKPKVTHFQL